MMEVEEADGGGEEGGEEEMEEEEEVVIERKLRPNQGKEGRERKHGKTKWILEEAKEVEDQLNLVRDQLAPHVRSPELHGLLFHKDFRKQVEGMKELSGAVAGGEEDEEALDNLDLLLKLCSLRLCAKAANTAVALAVLELLRALFDCVQRHQYRLSEVEAQVCLPVLMEQVGSNNDNLRSQLRALLRRAAEVYPASKVFAMLVEVGGSTRNQRAKAEVLGEMAGLISTCGFEQLTPTPSKAVGVMVGLLSERDLLVRNQALECLEGIHACVGQRLWKMLGRMEGKEKELLEARLQKSSTRSKAAEMMSPPEPPARSASMRKSTTPAVRESLPDISPANGGGRGRESIVMKGGGRGAQE